MKKSVFCICLLIVLCVTAQTNAQSEAWVGNVEKLDSAQPQECWVSIGVRVAPTSTNPFTCPEGSVPYTPQTYTWSMAVVPPGQSGTGSGEKVWFGTGGNVLCTTEGSFYSQVDSSEGRSSVCEFGESSQKVKFPGLPNAWGDWYPPLFYQYDVATRTKIDRTPYNDPLRNRCAGLRSAGYHNGVVFYAGGGLGGGINMFAFNASTGAFLGSRAYSQYRTIRKWVVVGNQLYTGVGTTYYGRILRWTGSVTNPFSFTEVGILEGVPRELTGYVDSAGRNRLAVNAKGVFVSPVIPASGLTTSNRNSWIQAWSTDQYEPDYTTRTTYVGGGIAFLNGWLYFGTMHIPGNAADLHQTCTIVSGSSQFTLPSNVCFGDVGDDYASSYKSSAIYSGTSRATSIWRIKNPESASRQTQLLYGEATLRRFNPNHRADYPPEGAPSEDWQAWMDQVFEEVPNLGNYVPLLGSSGFNNSCNNYSWVMQTVGNNMFTGTMDYCSMGSTSTTAGADLWRIDSSIPDVINPDDPNKYQAFAETTRSFKCGASGAGDVCLPCMEKIYNYSPYGFRTLQGSSDGTKLYAGTATGVNLNAVGDGAGYQLLMLDSEAPTPTWYRDADGDGYGLSTDTRQQAQMPSGYAGLSCDCNDGNPGANPGATEICGNGIDDDCDGSVDECRTYYLDTDNDSWGDSSKTTVALSRPEGYDSSGGDCNDADPAVNPGVTEKCSNGIDDNCNGSTDEAGCVP
jgi:hypothetical protein